jgi:Ca2+-binding RTX toxin-like protein
VGFVADPSTGVWIADPYNISGSNPWETVGGTSLSAPAWASLFALANQGRAAAGEGNLGSSADPTSTQESLYNLPESDFNQIATGYNGFNAGEGYNLVTGLGTPIANQLIPDLVANTVSANSQRGITVTAIDLQAYVGVGGGGGIANEMNVFDVILISSPERGSGSEQSQVDNNGGISRLPAPDVTAISPSTTLVAKASSISLLNGHGKEGATETIGNSNLPIHGALPVARTGTQQPASSETAIDGSGNVLLLNGPNNDSLLAIAGDGLSFAGMGYDVTISGTGSDVLVGGDGSDLKIGAAGHDMMIGGFGSDNVTGNPANDLPSDWNLSVEGVYVGMNETTTTTNAEF